MKQIHAYELVKNTKGELDCNLLDHRDEVSMPALVCAVEAIKAAVVERGRYILKIRHYYVPSVDLNKLLESKDLDFDTFVYLKSIDLKTIQNI